MKYRPEIDGLRALAITFVVLFHTNVPAFQGGFIGVDIFFVITGYLMTKIIVESLNNLTFSILSFYSKRLRRIAPAMFFMLIIVTIISWLVLTPNNFLEFSESLLASSIFLSNIYYFRNGNYFDANLADHPLLHLWSLSIEMQFYLLFPLILLVTHKLSKKMKYKLIVIILLMTISFLSMNLDSTSTKVDFYFLTGRFWEFCLGSLAAFYVPHSKNKKSYAMNFIGVFLITFSAFTFNKNEWPNFSALAPTIGTAILIANLTHKNIVGKLLSQKYLVVLGQNSYNLFLFHYPFFVLSRMYTNSNLNFLLYLIIIVLALIVSHYCLKYIERPFRTSTIMHKITFSKILIFTILSFVTLGAFGKTTNGFQKFYLSNRLTDSERRAYTIFQNHISVPLNKRLYDNLDCKFSPDEFNSKLEDRFNDCHVRYGDAVVVIGDSHALNIFNILSRTEIKFILNLARAACRPSEVSEDCRLHENQVLSFIETNNSKIRKIIYHQSGTYLLDDDLNGNNLVNVINAYPTINVDLDNYRSTVRYLNQIRSMVDLVWVGFRPEPNINLNDPKNFSLKLKVPEVNLKLFSKLNNQIKLNLLNIQFIEFNKFVDLPIDFIVGNQCLLWSDTDHFSRCGEIFLSSRLLYKLE